MNGFTHVYLLISDDGHHHYVGRTDNLQLRVRKHNAGGVPHTAKFRPWRLETAIAFRSKEKAIAFEKYPKSGSGREFARRRL